MLDKLINELVSISVALEIQVFSINPTFNIEFRRIQ